MKVKLETLKFVPVTVELTLESLEDVESLYWALDEYFEDYGLPSEDPFAILITALGKIKEQYV